MRVVSPTPATRSTRRTTQQSLDHDLIEGKLHELLARQVAIEQRGDIVVAMAKQATVQASLAAPDLHAHPIKAGNALTALGAVTAGVALPASARAYAPMDSTVEITGAPSTKPRPLDEPQKHSALEPRYAPDAKISSTLALADNPDLTPTARIGLIALSLDRTDRKQLSALQMIDAEAKRFNERWGEVIDHTGLSFEDITGSLPKGEGGPFIPLTKEGDTSEFARSLDRISHDVAQMERLKRVLPFLPIREPLFGEVRETSPFGYRPDPFLGRPALHPGIDLVQSYGAEIHATASGKIVHAGWMGGYGNMVEVDHGNGIATRYGHMSEVLVAEGDSVKIGDVLGRIGSTGRSTGPHLHYEVRIDGEPVDPERYLEVAAIVTPATQQ